MRRMTAHRPCSVNGPGTQMDTVHMFDRDRPPAVRL